MSSAQPWIRTVDATARTRLICLGPAGTGTADFRGWRDNFPGFVDVCPVVLPGRETRMSEPAAREMGALVRALAPGIAPVLRMAPYAIYGHSMGAWVAFELTRALRASGLPLPRHLFLGARRAPDVPPTRPRLSALPDDAFVAGVQERYGAIPPALLAEPEILRLFLPTLRADFALLDAYVHAPDAPLAVPITAIRGTEDPTVDAQAIAAWRPHTTAAFTARQLPGGHFYLRESRDLLCDLIGPALRP